MSWMEGNHKLYKTDFRVERAKKTKTQPKNKTWKAATNLKKFLSPILTEE